MSTIFEILRMEEEAKSPLLEPDVNPISTHLSNEALPPRIELGAYREFFHQEQPKIPVFTAEELDIDPGFDSEWQTGEVKFRSLRLKAPIHPLARFKDKGIGFLSSTYSYTPDSKERTLGVCEAKLIALSNKKDFFLETYDVSIKRTTNLNQTETEFVRGHEEGHAIVRLGQMTKLYLEARILGFTFDFLNPQNSVRNDESVNNLLSMAVTEEDARYVLYKEHVLDESIANVGGLVALVKSGKSHNLVTSVKDRIQKMELVPFPFRTPSSIDRMTGIGINLYSSQDSVSGIGIHQYQSNN